VKDNRWLLNIIIVKNFVVKYSLPISCLLILLISISGASVRAGDLISGLSTLSDTDIRNSAIAFVNTSTSPGLEGAILKVDTDTRYSEQSRSSLGFSGEFTIKDHIFNGYWGFAIVGGSLSDKLDLVTDDGEPVMLDVKRDVLGLRGSIGMILPINQHFKLRPYLSLSISDLQTNSIFDGPVTVDFVDTSFCQTSDRLTVCDTSAYMAATSATFDALYSRWFGDNRLELEAQYNLIYTDSISGDNPILNTDAWNHTVQLKSRFSGPASLVTSGRPWRWHVYLDHTNFLGQDKASLGYTGLFEIGTGLLWEMNIKLLDYFGMQSVGINIGVITSRNVEGYNVGLTIK
jgi:hypothetical protein